MSTTAAKKSSPPWLLGHRLRRTLQERLRRFPAFEVNAKHRRVVRSTWRFLSAAWPGMLDEVKVIPISSLEWTSEYRSLSGSHIVVFDVEQANAFAFLFNLATLFERPIFHQTEFLIRASEMFIGLGEIPHALQCAQQNFHELASYAERCGTAPWLSRPFVLGPAGEPAHLHTVSDLIPTFILAHEIGHAALRSSPLAGGLYEWVSNSWLSGHLEPGLDDPRLTYTRFQRPDTELYFNEDGTPGRLATKGIDRMPYHAKAGQQMCEENFADVFAFCATTQSALAAGLAPEAVFITLIDILESAERLLILRRLLARIPRGGGRGVVRFEASTLRSRFYGLLCLVRECWKGTSHLPSSVIEFWSAADDSFRAWIASSETERALMHMGDRSEIFARAGLHIGAGGELPDPGTQAARHAQLENYGPIGNGIRYLHAHGEVSARCVSMAANDDWTPDDEDPGSIGFCCAVARIAQILIHPEKARERLEGRRFDSGQDWRDEPTAIAMRVREPRICARAQNISRWTGEDTHGEPRSIFAEIERGIHP